MIQNFIQEQVDTLARTLQRSVAIDDVGINLVAVSKHFDAGQGHSGKDAGGGFLPVPVLLRHSGDSG